MTILWNKVTWYSKFAAAIFFLVFFPIWTFYIGVKYEETLNVIEDMEGVPVFVGQHKPNTDSRLVLTRSMYENNSEPYGTLLLKNDLLNRDMPTSSVIYTNKANGISISLPYNSKWGNKQYKIQPYEFVEEGDYASVQFGPLQVFEGGGLTRLESLTFLDQTPVDEVAKKYKQMQNTNPTGTFQIVKANGLDMVEYYERDADFCPGSRIEVIGKKYNYEISNGCNSEGRDIEYLRNIAKTIKLID